MASELKKGYITDDGKVFTTAQEARDYQRKPQVEAALLKISGGDVKLAAFLYEQEDEIMKSFEVGVVSRVTKSERNKLKKCLDQVATIPDGKLKFLQDNAEAVLNSFRWPGVKRLKEEEKAAETLKALTALADPKAADWIIANRVVIEAAYQAGVEKRPVNEKAMAALAIARDKRTKDAADKKAAEELAKAAAANAPK
jgi:hypothetical protein